MELQHAPLAAASREAAAALDAALAVDAAAIAEAAGAQAAPAEPSPALAPSITHEGVKQLTALETLVGSLASPEQILAAEAEHAVLATAFREQGKTPPSLVFLNASI